MRFAWIAEPPFNFSRNGVVTGSDVELARLVCAALGEPFDPVETEFAQLLPGLGSGSWDVATGMFVTPARMAHAAFTMPIWALRDGFLVRRDGVMRIGGYGEAAEKGARVAVLRDQVQMQTALANGVAPGAIQVFETYEAAAEAVSAGRADAYASVERAHLAFLARREDQRLVCVPAPLAEKAAEPGAFACRSAQLRDRMDKVLAGFLGSPAHADLLASFGFTQQEIDAIPGGAARLPAKSLA